VLIESSERLPEPGADTAALVAGAMLTAGALLAMAQRRDLLPKRSLS
jgi:hypothetical protein